jgi:hypothetical protein
MKGIALFPRGDNHKIVNIYSIFLKNLLQNQQANFNQTWHKLSLGKGILNCSNKGQGPPQRGDNLKHVKMGWGHLKMFSRTTESESVIFT